MSLFLEQYFGKYCLVMFQEFLGWRTKLPLTKVVDLFSSLIHRPFLIT